MGNQTKARLLYETEDTRLGSAHACCAVQDGLEYGLQVVRRTGNRAQHLRDCRPLPKDLVQLLLRIWIPVSSFGRFAGFLATVELFHRRCPSQSTWWARDSIAPAATWKDVA